MKAWNFRFANIIGERSGHGVLTDFIRKLAGEPGRTGDPRQWQAVQILPRSARMYRGNALCGRESPGTVNTFNIGSEDWIDVKTIAEIVCEEMHLSSTKFRFTGGERGWVGDVPKMPALG